MAVVGIRAGVAINGPGDPNPDVIEELTGLLERAKAGQVVGIVCSAEIYDGSNANFISGIISRNMLGGLHTAAYRLAKELNE